MQLITFTYYNNITNNHYLSLKVGSNTVPHSLGAKVLIVALLAVDLSLPVTECGTVQKLVTLCTCEASLVPHTSTTPHQLCLVHCLAAPGAGGCCAWPPW